ncbi:MAG: TetR/AcrR family transcriptional regulator [Bryobacterales bacterium]|nr:TetR/AcrR family transcriptional regulator [Bryobacterales bacterium]
MSIPAISAPKHRMPSGERRAAIVNAAIKLFSQNGFRGTTTKQLAQAVGVSEPVLYMHFATKSELYSAIIENLAERGEQLRTMAARADAEQLDDLAFFRQLAHLLMDWHREDPSRIRLLLYSALDGHELSELFYRRQVVPFLEVFASHIRKRIEDGVFRPVDPIIAGRAFCGMVGQYVQSIHVFGIAQTDDEQQAALDEMVQIFLNGVKK